MYRFHVETMTCGGCAAAITRAVQAADKTARVTALLDVRRVEIESTLSQEQLRVLLDTAGYTAEPEA